MVCSKRNQTTPSSAHSDVPVSQIFVHITHISFNSAPKDASS
jgi:hypothetical protein